jgi:hypothetical protein
MTTNEACLHNPDTTLRVYTVLRPDLPATGFLEVNGRPVSSTDEVAVAVPPGDIAVVRVRPAAAVPGMPTRHVCSVFAT